MHTGVRPLRHQVSDLRLPPSEKVEANQRMNESNDPTAVAMPVGQIVVLLNEIRPVADIIAELVCGFEAAIHRLDEIGER